MTDTVAENLVVDFHYTLTNDQGEVLDSSAGNDPLPYLHGFGNIIPGLENALLGLQVGDKKDVTVQPEDGYGPVFPEMRQEVPREAFQGVDEITVGMRFTAESDRGPLPVEVVAVSDTHVTVDGNHPLAGQVLHFAVEVVGIRAATDTELEHGHVHTPESDCES